MHTSCIHLDREVMICSVLTFYKSSKKELLMYLRFLLKCVVMIILTVSIKSEELFIPEPFAEGQRIEQLILISDVDGVIRDSVEAPADPRVIDAFKLLLENKNVDLTFISGTPIDNDLTLEPWYRGNVALNKVFGFYFEKELLEDRVSIFGVLGGQRMKGNGTFEVMDEYPPKVSSELSHLLIHAFLHEVLHFGNAQQKNIAINLQKELNFLSSNPSLQRFDQIVMMIREHLDPNFRLINNGASMETQTTNPLWNILISPKWIEEEMNKPQYLLSSLPPWQKQIASGFAKRQDHGFNFLMISKTNKGRTSKKHIEEKIKLFPRALIVTIGDTQLDFPMHQNAHLAFHVGREGVWHNNSLPQCVMIRNENGEDSQHVEGTLKVLKFLEEAIGKSFYDLKYIPKVDSSGKCNYYSLSEIR